MTLRSAAAAMAQLNSMAEARRLPVTSERAYTAEEVRAILKDDGVTTPMDGIALAELVRRTFTAGADKVLAGTPTFTSMEAMDLAGYANLGAIGNLVRRRIVRELVKIGDRRFFTQDQVAEMISHRRKGTRTPRSQRMPTIAELAGVLRMSPDAAHAMLRKRGVRISDDGHLRAESLDRDVRRVFSRGADLVIKGVDTFTIDDVAMRMGISAEAVASRLRRKTVPAPAIVAGTLKLWTAEQLPMLPSAPAARVATSVAPTPEVALLRQLLGVVAGAHAAPLRQVWTDDTQREAILWLLKAR